MKPPRLLSTIPTSPNPGEIILSLDERMLILSLRELTPLTSRMFMVTITDIAKDNRKERRDSRHPVLKLVTDRVTS